MKRTENGDEPAPDHNMFPLLNLSPNDLQTAIEMREHIIFNLMLWGNFYVLKNEDPQSPGDIASLWPLQAGYVTRRYRQAVWNFTDPLTGSVGTFTPDIVWRGTLMSDNGIDGTALTMLAREAIGLLLAAEEQGARLFSYGVQSDLQIVTADTLGPEEKVQFRDAFMSRHSGSQNAFMPFISEGGAKIERIGLTAQESQYIEARKFQIEDIARVFRYPEVLLGNSTSGKSSTYASAEQFFMSYTKHTLTPWAVRLEQTMHRDLLIGKDKQKYFFRHDFSSLLRGDTAARYASYETAINAGFMQPIEARFKERLPYKPGLDYFVPVGQPGPGADAASKVKPTDESGDAVLPGRVANFIFWKEHKALVGKKQDVDVFYAHFGGMVEDLTGADLDSVLAYLEMRRTTADKFSSESQTKAIDTLISLCTKDK
jgi:HK97 family phage portal protein